MGIGYYYVGTSERSYSRGYWGGSVPGRPIGSCSVTKGLLFEKEEQTRLERIGCGEVG